MQRILADIINSSFTNSVGKHQNQNPIPSALVVIFRAKIDSEVEEGFRYVDLAIYGESDHVQVYGRTRWDVTPVGKGSEGYSSGASEWTLHADHDTRWREGTYEFLTEHKEVITSYSETLSVPVENLSLPKREEE